MVVMDLRQEEESVQEDSLEERKSGGNIIR